MVGAYIAFWDELRRVHWILSSWWWRVFFLSFGEERWKRLWADIFFFFSCLDPQLFFPLFLFLSNGCCCPRLNISLWSFLALLDQRWRTFISILTIHILWVRATMVLFSVGTFSNKLVHFSCTLKPKSTCAWFYWNCTAFYLYFIERFWNKLCFFWKTAHYGEERAYLTICFLISLGPLLVVLLLLV